MEAKQVILCVKRKRSELVAPNIVVEMVESCERPAKQRRITVDELAFSMGSLSLSREVNTLPRKKLFCYLGKREDVQEEAARGNLASRIAAVKERKAPSESTKPFPEPGKSLKRRTALSAEASKAARTSQVSKLRQQCNIQEHRYNKDHGDEFDHLLNEQHFKILELTWQETQDLPVPLLEPEHKVTEDEYEDHVYYLCPQEKEYSYNDDKEAAVAGGSSPKVTNVVEENWCSWNGSVCGVAYAVESFNDLCEFTFCNEYDADDESESGEEGSEDYPDTPSSSEREEEYASSIEHSHGQELEDGDYDYDRNEDDYANNGDSDEEIWEIARKEYSSSSSYCEVPTSSEEGEDSEELRAYLAWKRDFC